ncbi:MAG: cysteine dioxygenase [Tatlockia sp.]|nr:cysteine dioxygenase [Tatlockia sp.]
MSYSKEESLSDFELIKNEISKLASDPNYELVSDQLPRLIAEKKLILNHSDYKPADLSTVESKGIGRYLIYDHPNKSNPFSIWVFAFASKQKTSIHDHLYKGTVIVLEEPISEKFYLPTKDNKAQLIERYDRYRFHTNKDDLKGNFVHQLKRRKNLGEGISLTLHIYNMEAHHILDENQLVDRRNLNKIYLKDKGSDQSKHLPYKEVFTDLSEQAFKF